MIITRNKLTRLGGRGNSNQHTVHCLGNGQLAQCFVNSGRKERASLRPLILAAFFMPSFLCALRLRGGISDSTMTIKMSLNPLLQMKDV